MTEAARGVEVPVEAGVEVAAEAGAKSGAEPAAVVREHRVKVGVVPMQGRDMSHAVRRGHEAGHGALLEVAAIRLIKPTAVTPIDSDHEVVASLPTEWRQRLDN